MKTSSELAASRSRLKDANLPMPVWEFVAMMAMMMGMTALAIDVMLPAIDDIATHYGRENPNDQHLIMFAYLAGFGVPQLVYGPVADRFGRKFLVRVCLIGYVLTAFACMATQTWTLLLAARFVQGFFAAGIRVTVPSILRDLTAGRGMARVMSLIMMFFMAIPILAPMLGRGVIMVSSWEWTFGVLGIAGAITFIWVELRLPETLKKENQNTMGFKSVAATYLKVFTTRETVGYMMAGGCTFSSLFAFIATSEQIFTDTFDFGDDFVFWFAGVALALVIGSFLNSRLVERLGMRRISHTVVLIFIALALSSVGLMAVLGEKIWIFYPLFLVNFACFGMLGANFSALALESQGERAGTASAAYGFATTVISAFMGYRVSSLYNGTLIPFMIGFMGLGVLALICVLVTERGRLFGDPH